MQPHEVLGVSPDATTAEITDAYRRFVRRHHPDHGGDAVRFRAGVDAYRRLTRPQPASRRSPSAAAGGNVVFHRRAHPGVRTLLRMAGHRWAAIRFRL